MRYTTLIPRTKSGYVPTSLFEDIDSELDNLLFKWKGTEAESVFSNYKETDEAFLFTVDLPGVSSSDINIETLLEALLVTAERKSLDGRSMSYKKQFSFPKNVDREKIQAHYENGVLAVALPKKEEAKPKKIEVTSGEKNKFWLNFLSVGEKKEEH